MKCTDGNLISLIRNSTCEYYPPKSVTVIKPVTIGSNNGYNTLKLL